MWLLELLPHWVFYTILSAGVFLAVGASVIKIRNAQIIGIILIVVSIWFIGGIYNDNAWQARVKDMEAKVVLAEAKSQTVNTEVITNTVTKIKVVKEKTNADVQYITKYVAKELDTDCKLTNASIVLHDSASKNEVPGSPSNVASTPSEIKASELLSTVVENYGTHYEVVEQVKGWQEWYWKQKKAFEGQK